MKHKILVGLIASLATTGAFAQSNVTIYGLVDTALRYTSHTDAAGDHTLALGPGAFQGARIGFKGTEDLGGGTSAVFQLENGFGATNGSLGQQGQLFGRQEYIGLKNANLGELDAGRQYGIHWDIMGNYDPLAWGNFNENSWQENIFGIRFDNTLKYHNTWGPVNFQTQYSFGGQAGSTSDGATFGIGAAYTEGPFSVGADFQQSKDGNGNDATLWGLGGYYVAGPAKVFLNYFDMKKDAGFAHGTNSTAAAASSAPLANTSLDGNAGNTQQRSDKVVTVGVLYNVTPSVGLTAAYMRDNIDNENSAGNSGNIGTFYFVADYAFSKRTDVYVEFDRTKLGGAEVAAGSIDGTFSAGNDDTRIGVAGGLRVKF